MSKIVTHRILTGRSTLLRRLCTAVEVKNETAATPVVRNESQTLYKRLSALGSAKGKASEILNEYIREGKGYVVEKQCLERCIKELRKFKKHQCALEIMEWMANRNVNFGSADRAILLDLIAKVQGVPAAEKYFNDLPSKAQDCYTYGSLLNCYCVEKMADEALALYERMDKMRYTSTLCFNNLMSLYMRLKKPEKVPLLAEEMKRRNIKLTTFTYNILMTSYLSSNDIEGVERVYEEMKSGNEKMCDWTTYSHLACAYSKLGFYEKAGIAMKKMEGEIGRLRNREGYHFLLSLYAGMSNRVEVNRIWSSLKSQFEVTTNYSYLIMVQSLSKLDDMDGLKKVFTEWELRCSSYDMRVANAAIGAYLRHDMVTEAEEVFSTAMERSKGPFFNGLEMFSVSFLKKKNADRALQCIESAISMSKEKDWSPRPETIKTFLKHFEEERDVDGAERFCGCLKKLKGCYLNGDVYKSVLQTYSGAGRMSHDMRTRMEQDGIDITDELESLLQKVCPQ
ncbi:unnamed protein product [Cuscuta campestris]|uniref:Pentacotripeptide-repeat region of PRORP domain-containing protein n=1 Tax=Cuscuta campestris TaxID=132261 RepID=A0A484LRT2_9ASTE|nr:unnamed protein product [Cuscuta campestris]